ncbi:hypothetical protein FSARC_12985 [Fusarium sarcochroum]|uniref:Uncharacterized protein n=1 Tax=Fusarium sarcochroum TaxID=1208366 RepID=A0A8H4WVB9_9HYPO|nr:hypothetical protein FSARC_12985 [Fusarium sarcochroum]
MASTDVPVDSAGLASSMNDSHKGKKRKCADQVDDAKRLCESRSQVEAHRQEEFRRATSRSDALKVLTREISHDAVACMEHLQQSEKWVKHLTAYWVDVATYSSAGNAVMKVRNRLNNIKGCLDSLQRAELLVGLTFSSERRLESPPVNDGLTASAGTTQTISWSPDPPVINAATDSLTNADTLQGHLDAYEGIQGRLKREGERLTTLERLLASVDAEKGPIQDLVNDCTRLVQDCTPSVLVISPQIFTVATDALEKALNRQKSMDDLSGCLVQVKSYTALLLQDLESSRTELARTIFERKSRQTQEM